MRFEFAWAALWLESQCRMTGNERISACCKCLSCFLDDYGHVTERANGVIADRIVDLLVPVLQRSAGQ